MSEAIPTTMFSARETARALGWPLSRTIAEIKARYAELKAIRAGRGKNAAILISAAQVAELAESPNKQTKQNDHPEN